MMFGSDATVPAAEGKTLESGVHPRTYGKIAGLLGKYVRDEKVIPMEEAIRTPWMFSLRYWHYVKQADSLGPDFQIRFSLGPVVPLPW